jgi:hypothetical protein
MKNIVFWDVTPRGSGLNRRFGGTYRLRHSPAMKMEAIRRSETSFQTIVKLILFPSSGDYNKRRDSAPLGTLVEAFLKPGPFTFVDIVYMDVLGSKSKDKSSNKLPAAYDEDRLYLYRSLKIKINIILKARNIHGVCCAGLSDFSVRGAARRKFCRQVAAALSQEIPTVK